jgi:hypothetical protein
MDWDVLFDGVSIADKVISFDIVKGRGHFCKQVTVEVADYSLKDSIDLTGVLEDLLLEVQTNTGSGWISEGTFFIERCSPSQNKDAITLTLWGRDESAKLTQPFARKMSKEYDEDTTLYEIIEEILTDCGLEYDEDRMLIDDFIIYANSYSVQEMYPLEVLQQLVSVTDGFLYTDRQGQIWVVKDEYHWDDSVTELGATVIASIAEREDYPEFGNRVRVGSFADAGELNISINLQFEEYSVAVGEGITGIAVVTRKDGTPVPDGYKVEWTTDNSNYASWSLDETSVTTHRITDESQTATSRRLVSTDYPIRQVHSVTVVSTGEEIDVKEFNGTSIVLDDDLPFTDSAVVIDYSTGYATNTLVGGSTGEVEVDVHAIVETFVRDTQTIRVDTSSGDPTAEQAAYVTIVTKDFITDETITDPGDVRLDDILQGATEDGMLDLGLVEGGEHDISIRDVSGYKDTDEENEGLANDTIRVGQTVYETAEGEETNDTISDHNDLSNIQGGTTGQRYHLTAAELAALSTYTTVTQVNSLISTHAALTTGVHGAGANTLATDADIVAAIAAHVALSDPHTVYLKLAGRSGGQTAIGGTDSGDDLTLQSTFHATKGSILFGTSAYNEVNNRLGLGLTGPNEQLELTGNVRLATTTASTIGVIYKDGNRFLHNFQHPTGDTAIPDGMNVFLGFNCGNFTLGSTATDTKHGSLNAGLGRGALESLTTGYENMAIGSYCLGSTTTGYRNMAIGTSSMFGNTDGYRSVAIGSHSLRYVDGKLNVAIGDQAGFGVSESSEVDRNVFIGASAGHSVITGADYNLCLGYHAGDNITSGARNIMIGKDADAPVAAGDDQLNIGNTIYGDLANDKIAIGASPLTNECDVGCLNDGVLALKETSTPTADANYGKIYCKNDNKVYFQDGAGNEHEIAFA